MECGRAWRLGLGVGELVLVELLHLVFVVGESDGDGPSVLPLLGLVGQVEDVLPVLQVSEVLSVLQQVGDDLRLAVGNHLGCQHTLGGHGQVDVDVLGGHRRLVRKLKSGGEKNQPLAGDIGLGLGNEGLGAGHFCRRNLLID